MKHLLKSHVVLRTVAAFGGVQSDDLVAEDVAAWCEVGWHSHGPGVVFGFESVSIATHDARVCEFTDELI